MQKRQLIFLVIAIFFLNFLFADSLMFKVIDNPNDDGTGVLIKWHQSGISGKIILNRKESLKSYEKIATLDPTKSNYLDKKGINPGTEYTYLIEFHNIKGQMIEKVELVVTPTGQWFNTDKKALLLFTLIIVFSVIYYIYSARSGKDLYIRKISGLDSMDEAVGRATEMGKPILYIPGTADIDDMQTIAGLTILGNLAQKAAEYDAEIIVPVNRSMVLSTAREIVKEAFIKAGRPDAYKPDSVFYLTDDQFGFVAGVDGIIVREKPAANFYLGTFYAESLILAETGFSSGAIQVAGTAMPSQLPFFVAACDYTLIGEELFAASAYLSKDPHQLGSLKGQDVGKALFVTLLFIGVIFEMFQISFLKDFLTNQ